MCAVSACGVMGVFGACVLLWVVSRVVFGLCLFVVVV